MDREELILYRRKVIEILARYGFKIKQGKIEPLDIRESQRRLAEKANTKYKIHQKEAAQYFAGSLKEINPDKIKPRLELVKSPKLRKIFNYAKSYWSVPVSAGFGRRMDYILWDDRAGKVIGIFGLCDPVIALSVRDAFIGWNKEQKKERLYNLMTAYILGAVPPYNQILGAKLVALAAASKEVVEDFYRKYKGKKTVISGKEKPPYLVAIDTMGAFGKSAIYTRLKGWKFVGYTKGKSHLHLTLTEVNDILIEVIKKFGDKEILKSYNFGQGPNFKLRVINKALSLLGLQGLTQHSIKRGYYFAPLAANWREFLTGKDSSPAFTAASLEENFAYWRERWLVKRWPLKADLEKP